MLGKASKYGASKTWKPMVACHPPPFTSQRVQWPIGHSCTVWHTLLAVLALHVVRCFPFASLPISVLQVGKRLAGLDGPPLMLHDGLRAQHPLGLTKKEPESRAVLKEPDFFLLLRTALADRPKGPPTANRQLPPTTNRHQPPTTNRHQPPPTVSSDQPPTANHYRPPPITNHQSPTTNRCQPPPTTTNRQLPTANRQSLPTANCQSPPTMVEHMECPRAFLGNCVTEHLFFFR